MEVKNYYATAQYYTDSGTKSSTLPAFHRYFLFVGFDEHSIKLVTENSLSGEWSLMSGKKETIDFTKESICNGRELSEISEYTGQVYKRTPIKKTFLISLADFNAVYNRSNLNIRQQRENTRIFQDAHVFEEVCL